MSELAKAVEHLEKGEWQAAHVIVQSDSSAEASWAHALVHVLEGDLSNAGYWYRKAGRTMPDSPDVPSEIAALKRML